jgi:hypothetical protein
MKKIFLLSLLTICVCPLIAQPGRENPRNSPDANPYEKVLEDTARGKRTAKFLMNFTVPQVLRDYFTSSPCNDYVVLSETRIQQFEAFVQQFLSGPSDPKQMKMATENFKKAGTGRSFEQIGYHFGFIEKQGTFTNDQNTPVENLICRAKGSIQALKSELVFLKAVKKIFPETPGVDDGISRIEEGLKQYPDNKSLLALIKKNRDGEIADVYMPKAVTRNAEQEGWFKQYFTKNYPGYTIVSQALLTADWYVKKNDISGLPEYRQIGTAIGAKGPDGKCRIIKIDLYQDYMGGKFSSSRFKEFTVQEMACENLN